MLLPIPLFLALLPHPLTHAYPSSFPSAHHLSKRRIKCLTQPPSAFLPSTSSSPSSSSSSTQQPASPLLPATIPDCISTAHAITLGDKAFAPMTISRSPNLGFDVPHSWRNGTCAILIDTVTPTDSDTFQLKDIAVQALKIIEECVSGNVAMLGGRDVVGPRGVISVTVLGREPPASGVGLPSALVRVGPDGKPVPEPGSPSASQYGDPTTEVGEGETDVGDVLGLGSGDGNDGEAGDYAGPRDWELDLEWEYNVTQVAQELGFDWA